MLNVFIWHGGQLLAQEKVFDHNDRHAYEEFLEELTVNLRHDIWNCAYQDFESEHWASGFWLVSVFKV